MFDTLILFCRREKILKNFTACKELEFLEHSEWLTFHRDFGSKLFSFFHLVLLLFHRENLVSINDVLLSLKRLQKVPDDMRLQRILEVLDEDRDGFIDIKNILEVKYTLPFH